MNPPPKRLVLPTIFWGAKARKEVLLDFMHYVYTLDLDVLASIWRFCVCETHAASAAFVTSSGDLLGQMARDKVKHDVLVKALY